MRVSIIVPVLDEADGIVATLDALAPARAEGHEVIVVDGGSSDATRSLALPRADAVLESRRGRARQMNAGAAQARGDVLLFLHADTRLPPDGVASIVATVRAGGGWGRFDVRIASRERWLGVVARFMNARSRLTGIATGDQAMFVRQDLFDRVGGFPDQPLMEDIELSRRLRLLTGPACLRSRVVTSGRRWERHGVWRTIVLMWRLRWRYWRGASADELARDWR
jgi:rSAM/selenodomain-associated transferase 2